MWEGGREGGRRSAKEMDTTVLLNPQDQTHNHPILEKLPWSWFLLWLQTWLSSLVAADLVTCSTTFYMTFWFFCTWRREWQSTEHFISNKMVGIKEGCLSVLFVMLWSSKSWSWYLWKAKGALRLFHNV